MSRRTLGRRTTRAVDLYNAALSRLLLVAPESVLRPVEAINELVAQADTRDASWEQEWSAARGAFTSAARETPGPGAAERTAYYAASNVC